MSTVLEAVLEGSSVWTTPFESVLEGSSVWSVPEFEAVLEGSSVWGIDFEAVLEGSSQWLTKEAADYRGTGGLYERPAGVSVSFVSKRIRQKPNVIVKLGGTIVPVLRGSIRLTRNTPIEWQIELNHNDEFDPTSDVATACRTKSATWSIIMEVGPETYKFTNLISDDYSVDDQGNVTVTGTDISERLNHKGHQPDVDCSDVRTVFEDLSEFGATVVSTFDTKLDYYHRIGRPIEWLRDWCGPLADWQVENGKIVVRPVEYGKPTRWSFTEREDLEVLDYQATPWAIRNKAVVQKEVGGQGILLEINESAASQFEGGFFGAKGPYSFPEPARQVRAHVLKAERGAVTDFSFLGAGSNAISGLSGIDGQFSSNIPIAAVRFNYEPGSPEVFLNGLFQPGYHVIFTGITAGRAQCNNGAGGNWTGFKAVTGGLVQEYDAPFVYQHFTADVGQALADALAFEGALKGETVNWQTELAPWCRPGFNVSLTERKITKYNGKTVFLQSMEHTWDHSLTPKTNRIVDSGTTKFDGSALLS